MVSISQNKLSEKPTEPPILKNTELKPCKKQKSTTSDKMTCKPHVCCIKVPAPGGDRTRDLRITSPLYWANASTVHKYDAQTNCASGADCTTAATASIVKLVGFNSTRKLGKTPIQPQLVWIFTALLICIAITFALSSFLSLLFGSSSWNQAVMYHVLWKAAIHLLSISFKQSPESWTSCVFKRKKTPLSKNIRRPTWGSNPRPWN